MLGIIILDHQLTGITLENLRSVFLQGSAHTINLRGVNCWFAGVSTHHGQGITLAQAADLGSKNENVA